MSKKLVIASAVIAAGAIFAPPAHAQPQQGTCSSVTLSNMTITDCYNYDEYGRRYGYEIKCFESLTAIKSSSCTTYPVP
jgi:hypothetical protein